MPFPLSCNLQTLLEFGLFMLMGAGASWILPSALFNEIPYIELHVPEHLCVSTYMNISVALGYVSLVLFFIARHYFPNLFTNDKAVPSLLIASCVATFITAAIYNIKVGKVSLLLYICCFVGGSIGNLSSVVMSPFMTSFKQDYISAARAGASFYTLLCALVSLIQGPGTINRFKPSIYFVIFGSLLILPIIAYIVITKYKIGYVATLNINSANNDSDNDNESVKEFDVVSNPVTGNTAPSDGLELGSKAVVMQRHEGYSSSNTSEPPSPSSSPPSPDTSLELTFAKLNPDTFDKTMNRFYKACIPSFLINRFPFLPYTAPYMLTVAWINFNTWGLISALAPFAFKAVAKGGAGAGLLATAYQVGSLALIMGDISTTIMTFNIRLALVIYTSCAIFIYIMSSKSENNSNDMHSNGLGALLVVVFALNRFIEAHLITTIYRLIASSFSVSMREDASRAVGISDQSSTIFGAIIAVSIVSTSLKCDA